MSYIIKSGKNNSIIFNIIKKLDRESFENFEEDILNSIKKQYSCYIFCFENMEYLASRVIGVMIKLRKSIDEDIPIYLVSPSLYIIKILDILNIRDFFHIVDSIDGVYEKKNNLSWHQN